MGKAEQRRSALVEAAATQFHQRGINGASLAEIARAAGVPAGNVFYYFRTKDELSAAVAADWAGRVSAMLAEFDEQEAAPLARIRLLLDRATDRGGAYAAEGCPLAAIIRDFRQLGLPASPAAEPLRLIAHWLERQFAAVQDPAPGRHARFLLAGLQGGFLLAHAEQDAAIVADVTRTLDDWLRQLG